MQRSRGRRLKGLFWRLFARIGSSPRLRGRQAAEQADAESVRLARVSHSSACEDEKIQSRCLDIRVQNRALKSLQCRRLCCESSAYIVRTESVFIHVATVEYHGGREIFTFGIYEWELRGWKVEIDKSKQPFWRIFSCKRTPIIPCLASAGKDVRLLLHVTQLFSGSPSTLDVALNSAHAFVTATVVCMRGCPYLWNRSSQISLNNIFPSTEKVAPCYLTRWSLQ